MKILRKILAIATIVALLSQSVFAQSLGTANLISGSSVTVELAGRVEATIISVIMPTRVEFAVTPEIGDWNKVLSPDFTIRNVGNVMLNVSISKAVLTTDNAEFSLGTPEFKNDTKQIRIGMAPKNNYSGISGISSYLFSSNVSDASSIVLTNSLDYSLTNNSSTFSLYGDISSGWQNGDEFNISTVFRVSLKK